MQNCISDLQAIVGAAQVLTDPTDCAPYYTDWRGRYHGQALAVVRPASTKQVAAIVKLCTQHGIAMVPQGGNTGLCGGATPLPTSSYPTPQIVLSLQRLRRVRQLDSINQTITVEAGCTLQAVQIAAQQAGHLFPLSLASEGTCTIGGNLATNAGGTAVLRYGNARSLCLGLEVVTANGEIWDGLRALRKDNSGYDLRDIFIGAEGTLGIITAAVLQLHPQPRGCATAFIALPSMTAALTLLNRAQKTAATSLTTYEYLSQTCLNLVEQAQLGRSPFPDKQADYQHYVLLELSSYESAEQARELLENLLESAFQAESVLDAVIAESGSQRANLWALRENISEAQAKYGQNIKHDIALPISQIANFVKSTNALLTTQYPYLSLVTFGHLGDGNLHYNVSPAPGMTESMLLEQQVSINRIVHDAVHQHGGSISAEHGLGQLKREEIRRYKSGVELALQQQIKQALDPLGLMNPGKVL